jgi:hypothetical protein
VLHLFVRILKVGDVWWDANDANAISDFERVCGHWLLCYDVRYTDAIQDVDEPPTTDGSRKSHGALKIHEPTRSWASRALTFMPFVCWHGGQTAPEHSRIRVNGVHRTLAECSGAN